MTMKKDRQTDSAELRRRAEERLGEKSGQAPLLKKGGAPLYIRMEAVAAESGEECRLALIDITELKRAEDEIKKLNVDLLSRTSKLESSNRDLAAFNYMVSHDLNRPLKLAE